MIHPVLVHMLFCIESYAEIGGTVMIAGAWEAVRGALALHFHTPYDRSIWPLEEHRDLAIPHWRSK